MDIDNSKRELTNLQPLPERILNKTRALERAESRVSKAQEYVQAAMAAKQSADLEAATLKTELREMQKQATQHVVHSPSKDDCLVQLRDGMERVLADMTHGTVGSEIVFRVRDQMKGLFQDLTALSNQVAQQVSSSQTQQEPSAQSGAPSGPSGIAQQQPQQEQVAMQQQYLAQQQAQAQAEAQQQQFMMFMQHAQQNAAALPVVASPPRPYGSPMHVMLTPGIVQCPSVVQQLHHGVAEARNLNHQFQAVGMNPNGSGGASN